MRNKSFIWLLTVCFILVSITGGCQRKESKYKDEIESLEYVAGMIRTMTREIDRAPNELAIHTAIIEFMSGVKHSKEVLNKLEEEFPDFKVTGGAANAPNELQPALKKFQTALSQLRTVVEGKKSKYAHHKSVMERFRMLWGTLYHY